jgi:hypothetical protein
MRQNYNRRRYSISEWYYDHVESVVRDTIRQYKIVSEDIIIGKNKKNIHPIVIKYINKATATFREQFPESYTIESNRRLFPFFFSQKLNAILSTADAEIVGEEERGIQYQRMYTHNRLNTIEGIQLELRNMIKREGKMEDIFKFFINDINNQTIFTSEWFRKRHNITVYGPDREYNIEPVVENNLEEEDSPDKDSPDEEILDSTTTQCFDVIAQKDRAVHEYLLKNKKHFVLKKGEHYSCDSLKNVKQMSTYKKTFIECNDDTPSHWLGNRYNDHVKPGGRVFVKMLFRGAPVLVVKPDWMFAGPVPEPRLFELVPQTTVSKFVTSDLVPSIVDGFSALGADHCNQTSPQMTYKLEPVLAGGNKKKQKQHQQKKKQTHKIQMKPTCHGRKPHAKQTRHVNKTQKQTTRKSRKSITKNKTT